MYLPAGPSFDFGSPPWTEKSQLVLGTVLDPQGVPQVRYPFGVYYNPTAVAQYGLEAVNRYLEAGTAGHVTSRSTLKQMADWLVANQDADGRWLYRFDLRLKASGVLRSPWPSAIAQGTAMSLLTRAYLITHDSRYWAASARALQPFHRATRNGGVLGSFGGQRWYEEYPGAKPTHVLNGFMFALIGLYDECRWKVAACRLFSTGMQSLRARIIRFDRPGGSYYSANGVIASPAYHQLHVLQLRALTGIEPGRRLKRVLSKWAGYGP
jgi:hypothetical protein